MIALPRYEPGRTITPRTRPRPGAEDWGGAGGPGSDECQFSHAASHSVLLPPPLLQAALKFLGWSPSVPAVPPGPGTGRVRQGWLSRADSELRNRNS